MRRYEGHANFRGYRTWYVIYGEKSTNEIPLIVLHGGPAWPHYGMLPLSTLSEQGIPTIFYDQIGCGNSDRPDDPKLWSVDFFVEELRNLISSLGYRKVNLLGHSWGGTLAVEYTLKYPQKINRLILSSPLVDTQLWVDEANRLKDELPNGIGNIMKEHEENGTTASQEYKDAYTVFQQTFVCRIVPQPAEYDRADEEWGVNVYNAMWGPSEAFATGSLKNYSALTRLKNITHPTLIISGKYDEATPKQMELIKDSMANSKWTILENSSHSAAFEETEKYLQTVQDFLA